MNSAAIFAVIGALVVVVNVLTQVLKQILPTPARIICVVLSVVLTVAAFVAWMEISGTGITWYGMVGAIVAGFFVAYGAMFGYDNLYQQIADVFKGIPTDKEDPK